MASPAPKTNEGSKPAPSVFNEQGAVAGLADIKTSAEEKRDAFQPCIGFVQKAREKDISWAYIATQILKHGGPKLTGPEVSALFQEGGRSDPSPRAERKAQRQTQKADQVQASTAAQGAV